MSDYIKIKVATGERLRLLQNNNSKVALIAKTGPRGEEGPQGIQGIPGGSVTIQQQAPGTTWTLNHNLGFKPSCNTFNAAGEEIVGEVSHPSSNTTVVTFGISVSGSAVFS